MQKLDTTDLEPSERARIIKSAVTPRPIAWISTISEGGDENLAPFSSYNYVSSSQPVVMFTIPVGDDREMKDTPRNAIDTQEFAVNVVTRSNAQHMDRTSASLPPNESEFDFADVDRGECDLISPPRVADAAVTMECELYDTIHVNDRLVVFGEVVYFHLSDEVMTDGEIDMTKLDVIGRLGGPYYTNANRIELERQY